MNRKLLCLIFLTIVMFVMVLAQAKAVKGVPGNVGARWAFCIGINDYQDKRIVDLKNARNDARVMAEALKANGQFDEVILLIDEGAPDSANYPKKNTVLEKMNNLKGKVKPEDLVLFFFSGHGISNATGEGFLVLANSYRENLNGTSLMVKEVLKWLNEMGVKKGFILLDANRENFLQDGSIIKGAALESFSAEQQGAIFYAGGADQFGIDDTGGKMGAFTAFIIDGLNGHADRREKGGNGDGLVSFGELAAYLKNGLSQWASDRGKKLIPEIKFFFPGFSNLLVSSYSGVSAELVKGFSAGSAPTAGAKTALRNQPRDISAKDAPAIIKRLGFFDKSMNPGGDCQNNFQAKVLNSDKVVVDDAVGLMWHPAGSELAMELSKAKEWLSAFNARKYAGFSDWRLPTIEEAWTVLESSAKNGNLFVDPIFSSALKNMWTCDYIGAETAWYLSFDTGKMNRDYVFNYVFVRPVRNIQ